MNVGNPEKHSLKNYVKIIEKNLAKKALVKLEKMQLGDVKEITASIRNLNKIVKKKDFISLKIGIKHYIDWFKQRKIMFADNDYYGHRLILSKYCKKNSNCFASIQHGILTPPQEKDLGKRKFIFSPFVLE